MGIIITVTCDGCKKDLKSADYAVLLDVRRVSSILDPSEIEVLSEIAQSHGEKLDNRILCLQCAGMPQQRALNASRAKLAALFKELESEGEGGES
jgi:hypothetical protein